MRIKLSFILLLFSVSLFGQSDTFNVVFQHDFESNSLGYYHQDTIDADWDLTHDTVYVINDSVKIVDLGDAQGRVMRVLYSEGQYGLHNGADASGASWTGLIPGGPYTELYMGFMFKLNSLFDPVLSGKINALYGSPQVEPCVENEDGFGVILIWDNIDQEDYQYMSYTYHMTQQPGCPNTIRFNNEIPMDSGEWHHIAMRIVMNTIDYEGAGDANGILEIFWDSIQVYTDHIYTYRNYSARGIDWMQITTFFGGGEDPPSDASKDEYAWFDDFSIWYYKPDLDTIVYGLEQGENGRHIPIPSSTTGTLSPTASICTDNEYYNANGNYIEDIKSGNYEGQTFTVGEVGENKNIALDSVSLKVYKLGSPGTMKVAIFAMNAADSLPTGDTLSQGTFDGDELSATAEWINVTMTSVTLLNGSSYVLLISGGGVDDTDEVKWVADYPDGDYDGGVNVYYLAEAWGITKEMDLSFGLCGHYVTSAIGFKKNASRVYFNQGGKAVYNKK